ncbi:MAG: YjcZ family sporulation protein [Bacilli bacterium]
MSVNSSHKGSNGFLTVVVLYILLAIILGSAFLY